MKPTVDWEAIYSVKGVELGTAAAGVKYEGRDDLVLIRVSEGATVAGVFTQNAFAAAPVHICREHLKQSSIRYLLINSGNANACTGQQGHDDAIALCQKLASIGGVDYQSVLPFSTGVIGELLPVDKMVRAIPLALNDLEEAHWEKAAKAIMTTDTVPKVASQRVEWQGQTITITGMSKGAGMIRPNMATMLGYIATDAKIDQQVLEKISKTAANQSFNRITIDGDTSTNDSCMLIASGESDAEPLLESSGEFYELLSSTIISVYQTLAQAIVYDGEGATKFVTVSVNNGKDSQESLDVAYAVAHSPLVKTAMFASDPNWGRIVCAIGYSNVQGLDASRVSVWIDDVVIVENGGRAASYTEEAGQAVFNQDEFTIRIDLNRGSASETLWTSDLSHDYVKINAEYRT